MFRNGVEHVESRLFDGVQRQVLHRTDIFAGPLTTDLIVEHPHRISLSLDPPLAMCLRRLHRVSADDATTLGWVNSISAFLHILISAVTATAANCSASRPWPWRTRFIPPFCRRRARRNPDLRPAAQRAAHRARGRAPGRRRGEPARRQTGVGPAGRHPGLLGPAAGQLSPLRRRRAHHRTPPARPGPPA